MCLSLSLLPFSLSFLPLLHPPPFLAFTSMRCWALEGPCTTPLWPNTFSLSPDKERAKAFLSRACAKHDEGGICSNSGRIRTIFMLPGSSASCVCVCACVVKVHGCCFPAGGRTRGQGFSRAPHLSCQRHGFSV